jgi:hypothetical protein
MKPDEQLIESQMMKYYSKCDVSDLSLKEGIINAGENYAKLHYLGIKGLLTLYCAKGKYFDQTWFKSEMVDVGVVKLCAHKVFCRLQDWRRGMSTDNTESAMLGSSSSESSRILPESVLTERYCGYSYKLESASNDSATAPLFMRGREDSKITYSYRRNFTYSLNMS